VTASRREIEAVIGAVERVWGPRSVRVENGPAAGRRQIDLRRLGGLDITVEPDQFLDLGEAAWLGDTVSFTPPSTSTHAESWGRRWLGGLLTTCGLTAVGQAPPDEGGMHGRAQLVPATVTRVESKWNEDQYQLEIAGKMREGAVFEENLTVDRTIRAVIGESRVQINDLVRNEGFGSVPVKLLYHINLGWPLVDSEAQISAAAIPASGFSETSNWVREMASPVPLEPERVDPLVAVSDDDGWSSATLHANGTDVVVRYRTSELPYLTIWRSAAAGSYALGIEPGTCWPSHVEGPDAGKAGRILKPGESFTAKLEIEFVKHQFSK